MNLAFNSKSPFVPNPAKDPSQSRWIASLSDGTTVFEDVIPGEESAWFRLKKYVELHKLKVTNLRLEAYGRRVVLVPYYAEENIPQLNGYFYSKRWNALLGSNQDVQWQDIGIGFVKAKLILITWINPSGDIKQEVRDYVENNLALIINDVP